jgi:hypothetical protein
MEKVKNKKRMKDISPFPKELAYRAIKLFSFIGAVAFDAK